MQLIEKKISSEKQYGGKIVSVYLDKAELINGKIADREVVTHPGGVGILPIDENLNCYMVKQFRYPLQEVLLEIPAGKLEKDEDPYFCAVRELKEETGFDADRFDYFGKTVLSPGYSTEVLHIYIATGLHSGNMNPDEDEFLNVEVFSLKELYKMVMSGTITDAKSVIAILVASQKYL